MLKKVLSKSGRRILKAIKKFSTKTKSRSSDKVTTVVGPSKKECSNRSTWRSDHEELSLSWSLASFDTKSIDTYITLVSDENGTDKENLTTYCNYIDDDDDNEKKCYCCCCCVEYEAENQRNENRENEMFI